ncbi:helix-turn-helix domain-containing protein [Roseovarius indicus]|uniref:helix-turn-helix domain-containing protein n=1 Tax=Roseovarius indicus TaxID=540747 RepID=UPI0007D8D0BD|nr:helix-turn-helix domain-containing protein [Roseovarius indicus]OAO02679.1 hypothetical protein A8B76_04885 [Roseovarius indicus]
MPAARDFTPRLMPAPQAAHYLGVSPSTLRELGLPRKRLGAKRVYDKADLDAYADSLPYDGPAEGNTCDVIFGCDT